ncbi:transposase [Streptomyces sp. NPDC048473]|uniref:transposase n=1 Tax=unclassified Streptomyces TaxID=2593676 RepID=UPI003722AE7F
MTSSTWPVDTVRSGLGRRAVAVVRPQVWVVDDTGFPKDGTSSPGVARQYSGTLDEVGNGRTGGSVHAASDTASCPLSWRLFLPGSWDGAQAADRRARCRVADEERHRPKWQLALDMLVHGRKAGVELLIVEHAMRRDGCPLCSACASPVAVGAAAVGYYSVPYLG